MKKKASVSLTQRALSDLREIEAFSITQWGRQAADNYLDEIGSALDRLSENPDILRHEPGFIADLYFYRVKKHFLVCEYQNESVIVLTVIHTAMDLPGRLSELEPRLVAEAELLKATLREVRTNESQSS